MIQTKRPTGMAGFSIIWIGQIVSVLATNMTGFGLTIWMYEKTGSVTTMALAQVFYITPFLLLSPLAGAMVDRYNRKLMMMLSDLAAGLGTVFILLMFWLGKLEMWHIYLAMALAGIGSAFQWPAYTAAISSMLRKEQYGRADGMMSLVEAGPGVVAPLFAGALLPLIGLNGIMLVDVVTFIFAIFTLFLVHIPQPVRTKEGVESQGNIWKESVYGFKYIFARPSLLGLQLVFFVGNLFTGIAFTLLAPMILARTMQSSLLLGTVQSVGAVGGVIGGIMMSVWGGFKRKVHGVLLGWILTSLSLIFLGIGQSLPVWAIAMAFTSIFSPLINTSNQVIWQSKVATDLQGRVFSARRLIAWFTNPISPIIAGTLADFVLEPAMRTHNAFSNIFGGWVGIGSGAGMALLVVFCGIGGALVGLVGYFIPAIRDVEMILPDHDVLPLAEPIES